MHCFALHFFLDSSSLFTSTATGGALHLLISHPKLRFQLIRQLVTLDEQGNWDSDDGKRYADIPYRLESFHIDVLHYATHVVTLRQTPDESRRGLLVSTTSDQKPGDVWESGEVFSNQGVDALIEDCARDGDAPDLTEGAHKGPCRGGGGHFGRRQTGQKGWDHGIEDHAVSETEHQLEADPCAHARTGVEGR